MNSKDAKQSGSLFETTDSDPPYVEWFEEELQYFCAYAKRVFSGACSLRDLYEDIVHERFFKFMTSLKKGTIQNPQTREHFVGYLSTMIKRRYTDLLKKQLRDESRLEELHMGLEEKREQNKNRDYARGVCDRLEQTLSDKRKRRILRGRANGMSYAELAKQEGV